MNDLLSKLYHACTCEDSTLLEHEDLAADYIQTGRADAPRRVLVSAVQNEDPDALVGDFGTAMEEQGFVNGVRYGVALAHELQGMSI